MDGTQNWLAVLHRVVVRTSELKMRARWRSKNDYCCGCIHLSTRNICGPCFFPGVGASLFIFFYRDGCRKSGSDAGEESPSLDEILGQAYSRLKKNTIPSNGCSARTAVVQREQPLGSLLQPEVRMPVNLDERWALHACGRPGRVTTVAVNGTD